MANLKDISDDFGTPLEELEVGKDNVSKDVKIKVKAKGEGEQPPEDKKNTPFYRKWWFWVILGVIIIAGITAFEANRGTLHAKQVTATTTVTEAVVETTAKANNETDVVPEGAVVENGSQGWGLYKDGELVANFTGLAENNLGTWYCKFGLVDFKYNGTYTKDGVTYNIEGGKVVYAEGSASDNTQNDNDFPEDGTGNNAVTTGAVTVAAGTDSQQQALRAAQNYLNEAAFSEEWLTAQVKSDGFSDADAEWAVEHVGADWNEQAYKKGLEYLTLTSFTYDDLVNQLVFEGFSQSQSEYGAGKALNK